VPVQRPDSDPGAIGNQMNRDTQSSFGK
jgi:hypothetical protein